MGAEPLGPVPPPGARFVAASSGRLFYQVGDPAVQRLPRRDLKWFASEAGARHAGLQSARDDPLGLDEFEVIRELGRGGTATVFHARDLHLGREVAIKVIHPSHLDDEESLARFAREARLLARLQHPGVVSVYSFHRLTAGGFALVMEYVPGRTLREIIRAEGPLPFRRVERILCDIGEVLLAAHAMDIVHRDVKPQNIFLHEPSGRAKLADFGIAIPLHESAQITHSGAVVGTPAYMSPEQVDGLELDGRTDLYSLGLVGWEMLAGSSPWEGESLFTIIYNQKQVALPSLETLRPDVPAHVRRAIEGAIEKDRESRWSDVGEFLTLLSGNSPPAQRWRRPEPSPQHPRAPAVGQAGHVSGLEPPADTPTVRLPRPQKSAPEAAAPVSIGSARRVRTRLWAATAAVFGVGALGLAVAAGDMEWQRTEEEVPASSADAYVWSTPATASPRYSHPSADDGDSVSAAAPLDTSLATRLDSAREAIAVSAPQNAGPTVDLSVVTAEMASDAAGTEASPPSTPEGPTLTIDFTAQSIAAGGMHSCAIDAAGAISCWGGNDWGQLGGGEGPRQALPTALSGSARQRSVVAGGFHSCMLDRSGAASCWGDNRQGQLGGGAPGLDAGPVLVKERHFASITLGIAHTCGISQEGVAYCWGSGERGQLGTGSNRDYAEPARVATGAMLVSLTAGWSHTCALTTSGQALCWGDNSNGQLGDGSRNSRSTPMPVSGDIRYQVLVAGSAHSCGLALDGAVYCWGDMGVGSTPGASPSRLRTPLRFVQLTAGGRHACGVSADGRAYCWGQNNYGQVGDGSTATRSLPMPVAGDLRFARVAAGGSHTCGTTRDGAWYCWGYNIEGQLGNGTLVHSSIPRQVSATAKGAR